jgi:hypothetical protein
MLSVGVAANQGCSALVGYLHKKKDYKKMKEALL